MLQYVGMESNAGFPVLPERISGLRQLAFDLWWTWNEEGREVFRRLDYHLWRLTEHNTVRMLQVVPCERLEQAAGDASFLAVYDRAMEALNRALASEDSWWSRRNPRLTKRPIAYFSAEFALHNSLPIYAGGLGVLAGDLCKEASDLGLPLVGVGFMYPQGYFHQQISSEGWQEEVYEHLNWQQAPIEPALLPDGKPCILPVPLGNRSVHVAVWLVRVGRVKLYLLDTDLEENSSWDRELSARLYGGDRGTRVQQEIILGIGGVRALRALGQDPVVWHLNEGHAAFVVLERAREIVERGGSFEQALEQVRGSSVFTTHTPVAAGHDVYPIETVEANLKTCWGKLDRYREDFLRLGTYNSGSGTMFNMTALALRSAGAVNGVSRVHGRVTRDMWAAIWPGAAESDRPVKVVTNGVHVSTWIAPDMAKLFERHMGAEWRGRHDEPALCEKILTIPDEELWNIRQQLRSYLIAFVRERTRQLWMEERVSASRVVAAGTLLDPTALTIGFARRCTEYKRPELVFHDPKRLAGILFALRKPVQIVFAGKAHPADDRGKHSLQRLYKRAADPSFGGRIAFIEDYDMHVAHFLVQGCDVWLNTPRRPLEASGTSGMKASINGVLHLSTGDGWWVEGYSGSNGWVIDGGVADGDPAAVDAAEADALYRLLEEEVVPSFYERDSGNIPRRWVRRVKEAIRTVTPHFSARRMLKQYADEMYAPAVDRAAAKSS
jgi:starch phosphorylase